MSETSAKTNAAIYYNSEGFDTSGAKLMGRQAAGEGFLAGFVRHAGVDRLFCYTANDAMLRDFTSRIRKFAPSPPPVTGISFAEPRKLDQAETLYLPGPNLADEAWKRYRHDECGYSLCGITHTTASHTAMDCIANLAIAPARPWDALICTSQVVRDTVHVVLDAQREYLRERVGATSVPLPQLPIIPLGVDCKAYAPNANIRATWRKRLAIGADDVAFLFFGRLSFHAKANPLPMYLGLQETARRTGKNIHLILTGWFANEHIEQAFRESAAALCPLVNLINVDGRVKEARREIWQAADVFTSLSDNIQETFGLVPIEAMAAGLPVVVTDWNGYRDTVRNVIDGIMVPTVMPSPPLGAELAARHESALNDYDQYIGYASQFALED